ncbi:low affinity immunoglobulin gamma Fc region receptor II-a-like [Amphiprion ocellaris]|uniref:low affinity immunoglobulin gamma Fc region receptor II-a-like n=1 Tax=Amphiprion ocellaris TaxID=80972 RepID=UPI002411233A|nr:low affinity immunoglobulin gamma Fc region receptor II-a-like [Amphiprion ocellaris]
MLRRRDDMEVRASCFRALLLLVALGHLSYSLKGDAASLHTVTSKQQFFEYESIFFRCVGLDPSVKWKGVRNTDNFLPTCMNDTGKPTMHCIFHGFETDSGKYWCESEEGERSSAVNITVTAGSVILESPAFPVTAGQTVILVCRNKAALANQRVDFYKDGLHIGTGCFGKMIIQDVSKSDEGLYKCSISTAGESPESWLTVTENSLKEETKDGMSSCCSVDSVVLDSPAHPVMEGEAVMLHCRSNMLSANLSAVFYKDELFIGTGSTGTMTIPNIYKSHEGLYKCRISGVGESPGNWLTVKELHRETCLWSDHFFHSLLLLRTVFTVVMVVLLLLLVGLLHFGKLGGRHKDLTRR